MTLAALPAPNFTGADLSQRLNAVLSEARIALRLASVPALLADTSLTYDNGSRGVAAGHAVVTADGFAYEVAPAAATNHHVATAGGVRLYVLPGPRGADIRAFGALVNGTANDWPAVKRALDSFDAIYLPAGTTRWAPGATVFQTLAPGRRIVLRGDRNATVSLASTVAFEATLRISTTLAADAAAGATAITLASASGVQLGDLVKINTATPVETGWGYAKQCVRRVVSVSGIAVTLDQPLDFWFTAAEVTNLRIYAPAAVDLDGVNLLADGGMVMSFRFLQSSSVRDATLEGPVPGWSAGFSDVFCAVSCSELDFHGVVFRKARYLPNITEGSRFISVRNFRADQVRHLDCNCWAQDVLFENGVGLSTDGIIQTHPAIRVTFRNVHDNATQTSIHGIDLRGFGEIVENCSAFGTAGLGVNTNRPLLTAAYQDMAARFTRRVSNFRSPTGTLAGGFHREFVVERCAVPSIHGTTNADGVLYVDEATRLDHSQVAHEVDRGVPQSAIDRIDQVGKPISLVPSDGFTRAGPATTISAITRANPGVVTSTAHGLANGDAIFITGVAGMTQVNDQAFRAANVTANTFELQTLAGVPVDTSGFGALSNVSGVVSRQAMITGVTQANPAVVTAAGHGLADGDVVYIGGVAGMTALNRRYWRVAGVAGDTFQLQTTAGATLGATAFPAWTSGGRVVRCLPARMLSVRDHPALGLRTKLWMEGTVHTETASTGSATRSVLVKVMTLGTGNTDQRTRMGRLRVRAVANAGVSEAVYNYVIDYQANTLTVGSRLSEGADVASVVASASGFTLHGQTQVNVENGSWAAIPEQHYWTFSADAALGATNRILFRLEVEIEEWRGD